jgi:hypothetical protein
MTTTQTFEHTLVWHCPACGRSERQVTMAKSREVEVDQKVCAGTLISHPAKNMYWTDHSVLETTTRPGMVSTRQYGTPPPRLYAQGGYVGPQVGALSRHHTPGKAVDFNMTSAQRNPFGALGQFVDATMLQSIAGLHTPRPNPAVVKAKEKAATLAKLQEGDVIQLVSKAGAVLQGEILALRRGNTSARIKGFDHVGGEAGGHHVYWPLGEFDVEILVESYRVTPEDRIIAVMAGYAPDAFKEMTESRRAALRRTHGAKARRVAELVKGEGG